MHFHNNTQCVKDKKNFQQQNRDVCIYYIKKQIKSLDSHIFCISHFSWETRTWIDSIHFLGCSHRLLGFRAHGKPSQPLIITWNPTRVYSFLFKGTPHTLEVCMNNLHGCKGYPNNCVNVLIVINCSLIQAYGKSIFLSICILLGSMFAIFSYN
jgi:hypothetical protein